MSRNEELSLKLGMTETGLMLSGKELTWNECVEAFTFLSVLHDGVQFAMGDILNYAEERFGESVSQLLDGSRYSYGTYRNWKWVSGAVPYHIRNKRLSWAHHQEVAPLPEWEQREWLLTAELEKLSRDELRDKIRGYTLISHGSQAIITRRTWPREVVIDRFARLIDLVPVTPDTKRLVDECREILDGIRGIDANAGSSVWLDGRERGRSANVARTDGAPGDRLD